MLDLLVMWGVSVMIRLECTAWGLMQMGHQIVLGMQKIDAWFVKEL